MKLAPISHHAELGAQPLRVLGVAVEVDRHELAQLLLEIAAREHVRLQVVAGRAPFGAPVTNGWDLYTCHWTQKLSKSLKPLPVVKEKDDKVFDAFTDPEARYRQRYVDLVVNPEVQEIFRKRTNS